MSNSTKKWEEKAKDFLPNHNIENLQAMLKKKTINLQKND